MVHIMPYIEQANIYNRLTFTGDSGWTNVPSSADQLGGEQRRLSRPASCSRSSAARPTRGTPLLPNGSNVPGGIQVTRPSYVAIAGAVDRLDAAGLFRETRMTTASWSPEFGLTAWGGVIVPGFSRVTFSRHHRTGRATR